MTVHKKVAEALGMAIPDEDEETTTDLVVVPPHEIYVSDNVELPDLTDIEANLTQGEKQLEEMIVKLTTIVGDAYDDYEEVEPKYRSRHLEVLSTLASQALDAIKHKTELQLKKAKSRLEQANFTSKRTGAGIAAGAKNVTNNIVFSGDREGFAKFLEGDKNE